MGCAASAPKADTVSTETTVSAATSPAPKSGLTKAAIPDSKADLDLIKAAPAVPLVGAEKERSKKSRARRLSYVAPGEVSAKVEALAKPTAQKGDESSDGEEETGAATAAKSRSKSARKRRLSYVVGEKEADIKAMLSQATPNPKESAEAISTFSPAEEKIKAMLEQSAVPQIQVESPSQQSSNITYSMACISRAGREPGFKKQNQDNCFAFEKFMQPGQALFGAFDGHGPEGHTVSAYVKQHLPVILVNHLGPGCPDVPAALRNCFLEVDKAMNATKVDCEFSGSTACVAHLNGRLLNVAWVGDSRGVMGRTAASGTGYEAVSMTTDHKPTTASEKARIVANNGRVERLVDESGQPIGPFRVWLQYAWIPGLAMSRALGDALAHQVGVTSEPEVFSHTLTPRDAFIILASDGVWEFIDSQDAVNIIGSANSAEEGCRQLVDEAFQRWLVEEEGVVDDITAVVVKFLYD